MWAIEAKCAGFNLRQAGVALGAGELLGEDQGLTVFHVGFDDATALAEGRLHRLSYSRDLGVRPNGQAVNDQLDVVPFLAFQVQVAYLVQHENLAVDPDTDEAGVTGSLEYVSVLAFLAADLGRHQRDSATFLQAHDGVNDLRDGLPLHGTAAFGAMGLAHSGEQQTQIIVDLRYRTHRGPWVVGNTFLVDGDGRREAFDIVDVWLIHPAQKLPGVGR